MIKGIFLTRKRGFFQKKEKNIRKLMFSPLLVIPLILVIISSLLIKSVQRDYSYSDFLSHILTGFFGYSAAIFISYIPIERIRKYLVPFYFCSLISLLLVYFFGISFYGAQRWLSLGIFSFQPLA